MAGESENKRKCFTAIWKIENASYWWNSDDFMTSPSFIVDEILKAKWTLNLNLSINKRTGNFSFYLERQDDTDRVRTIVIDYEIAFLSSNGTVLYSWEKKNVTIANNGHVGEWVSCPSRNEVFFEKKSLFLPQDTLTVRCRIWKNVGEMLKDVQCLARTRIVVEKRSLLWKIEDFSHLKSDYQNTYEIKSLRNGKQLMSLDLFLIGGIIYNEKISFKITPNFEHLKIATFQLSIVDASENLVKCFKEEFSRVDAFKFKYFTLIYTVADLLEKESVYLPNDVLSLFIECAFSFGTEEKEIESANIDCKAIERKKSDNHYLHKENELPVPKGILINDFKSMLDYNIHSDIKLKTSCQTYPAHKCILSVRSPVFKAMFSSDMKESITDCVDIEDLNDETLLRMLRYIYSAEIEELDWASAAELYEAADRYEILNLKDICSSYLKSNLGLENACEAMVLADLHQDKDLKGYVQDFILRSGKEIINSEEWEQLMKTNLKLAAETMCLKFKE